MTTHQLTTDLAAALLAVYPAPEAQAVAAARHYLSFFQGQTREWLAPDALALRDVVPENRLRVYDTLQAMQGLVDQGSLLVLRSGFGRGIHTALARIEGRSVGLLANNPQHLGGAAGDREHPGIAHRALHRVLAAVARSTP